MAGTGQVANIGSGYCIVFGVVPCSLPCIDGMEKATNHMVDDFWMHDCGLCGCLGIHGWLGTVKRNMGENRLQEIRIE